MKVEDRLRTFILEELRSDVAPEELSDEFPLLKAGVVDSLGVFQLVTFIEDEFGVEVRDEEIVADNFGSLSSMARLVESKRVGQSR